MIKYNKSSIIWVKKGCGGMKKIPIGVDNFEGLITSDSYYVDKTKVIEDLLDNQSTGSVSLFHRPRRFGKTLLMSTLDNFFDIDKRDSNKDLFNGLYINKSKYKDVQGTYPIINLSFKELKQNTYESVISQFRILMSSVYDSKKYIYDTLDENKKNTFNDILFERSSIEHLKNSIKFLSECLYRYHNKKVIILIDEYDVPIQEGYLDGFYDEIIRFIRTVLSSALKTNNLLEMAVLTGVLKVSKESIFSDLNNLEVYSIRNNSYEEYFGFTEEETKELLEYYGLELTKDVKDMYDGYDFGGVNIYNPWSILKYARNKTLDTYWINTSGNDLIKDMLLKTSDENKNKIETLALGKTLPFTYNDKITYQDFDNYNDLNNILNIMFSSGYLTLSESKIDNIGDIQDYVKIPNLEVKRLITDIMIHLNQKDTKNNTLYLVKEFNRALIDNNKTKIENILNEMFMSLSFMDSQEYFYHAYTLGIFKTLLDKSTFVVKSNREAGSGRFDVYIRKTDNSVGFIIEFKLAKSEDEMETKALEAIKQMKEKEYYKELVLEGFTNINEITMVFHGKKVIVR